MTRKTVRNSQDGRRRPVPASSARGKPSWIASHHGASVNRKETAAASSPCSRAAPGQSSGTPARSKSQTAAQLTGRQASWISRARTAGAASSIVKKGERTGKRAGLAPCPCGKPGQSKSRGQQGGFFRGVLDLLGLAGTGRHVAQAALVVLVQVQAVDDELAGAAGAGRHGQHIALEEAHQGPG